MKVRLPGSLVFTWILGALAFGGCAYSPYTPPPLAFSGDSASASQSFVIPTLDSPLPKGKNVIWCGTLQLAWDQMKTLGEVPATQPRGTIDRLNQAHIAPADLPDGSYYAATGRVRDGIAEKIRAEMRRRFPEVQVDLPKADRLDKIAYAYLAVRLKFANAYVDSPRGDEFTDSAGHKTPITTFGLSIDRDAPINVCLAKQIDVLYSNNREIGDPAQKQFVLDLDKNAPSELLLAHVEPRETLAATWQDVREKMAQWKSAGGDSEFSSDDAMVVPNVHYSIRERFPELTAADESLAAMQSIQFQLDRSGATLTSQAWVLVKLGRGRTFNFTRPFLIVMRKRGATEPYFMMWVDNAELLCKGR